MIIIYIEESAKRAEERIDELLKSLIASDVIVNKSRRTIQISPGIRFIVFTRDQVVHHKLRGYEIAAAFVNCQLDPMTREMVKYQVRAI